MVSRRKKAPVSTAKMYRHFAAITVVVTASMAFMADDNLQSNVKSELQKKATSLDSAGKQALAESGAVIEWRDGEAPPPKESEGFSGGGSAGFGAPTMATAGSGRVGASMRYASSRAVRAEPIWIQLGLTEKEWLALSQEERAKRENELKAMIARNTRDREASMRALTNASRIRSGGSVTDPTNGPGDDPGGL